MLAHEVWTFETYGDDFIEFLFLAVEERRVIRKRCIIDQYVDAAEALDGLLNELLDVRVVNDIAEHEHGFFPVAIELVDDGLAAPSMHFRNHDFGSLRRKQFSDRLADIASGAGNNCHLTLKLHNPSFL
jgi:hypothetical protein